MKPRPTDAEFEELKRKRDEEIEAGIDAICADLGWPRAMVRAHMPHAGPCYCACPDGPCQHIWDGAEYTEESDGGILFSVTCSRCGTPAIYHDMRCMP